MVKTITITDELWRILSTIKIEKALRSFTEVIEDLLNKKGGKKK